MIVVQLMGGLGNQMFQYAAGKCLAFYKNTDLVIDKRLLEDKSSGSYSLCHFDVRDRFYKEYSFTDRILLRPIFDADFEKECVFYDERDFFFNKYLVDLPGANIYLRGFFQSQKYFEDYKDKIRMYFTVTGNISAATNEMKNRILGSNAIALHVRRGDYITGAYASSMIGACDINYYEAAISYVEDRTRNGVFFVFSDDLVWAKENIRIAGSKYFVNINDTNSGYQDLYLMSLCKHNIISNSTFSWWAAWLNINEDKIVVSPERWFKSTGLSSKDIVPDSWIKL